ncbi:GldG family protein [Spectribacter hydrogenoxidans]|uniref:GldG family protein n=1 Tax=Spectribacter hydrogenoxidans TaxID=3075608 RepID=A0ABU3BYL6_9GAMM|nr:GldG family protein [Salinisphaera sp. W335]MDT0634411.1 GldG family protein [Salinisphaera sp. W335]
MRVQHALTILLMIAVAALLVFVSGRYTLHADWTHANRNSLTPASQRILDSMPGEIRFIAYAYPGPIRQSIRDQLDRYRRADDSVSLTFVDPAEAPQRMRELGVRRDGEVRVSYDERDATLDDLTEQSVTSTLQRLAAGRDQWVVFLTGHGERDPQNEEPGGYSQFSAALGRQGLKTRPLNLGESPAIPDNTSVLVIASPQQSPLPGEVELIRDYLDNGGNLLWLTDPSTQDPMPGLADALGLQWQTGTVIYPDYQALGTGHPALSLVVNYPRHPVTERLEGLTLFPFAGGVSVGDDTAWEAASLIRTPARSWLETGELDGEEVSFAEDDGDRAGPVTIGMALERKTGPPEGDGSASTPAGPQRAVALADSDFATNANLGTLGNRAFAMALIQWLAHRDSQIAVDVPVAPDASLTLAPWETRFIWLGFVIALPLLLLAIGLGRWWWRRRG